MRRTEPPSGAAPPQTFALDDGTVVDLGPITHGLCERYFALYPEDLERYAPASWAWCDHDTRYLLAWVLEDVHMATVDSVEQVLWLGRVLAARSFPIDHLIAHLHLIAEVLKTPELGETGLRASARMTQAATALALQAAGTGAGTDEAPST